MSSRRCAACGKGVVITRNETLSLREASDQGVLRYRVTVPVGRCVKCNHWRVSAEGEAVIEAKARAASERLAKRRKDQIREM